MFIWPLWAIHFGLARALPPAPAREHRAPQRARALARARREAQAEDRDGRRRAGHARRRLPGARRRLRVRLGELDLDAERLPRVQERLLPGRVGVVAADDRVAVGARARADRVEVRPLA